MTKVYNLNDEVQLKNKNGLRYKLLKDWIITEPITVYNHLYKPGVMKLRKIHISRPAYSLFKKRLANDCQPCFHELLRKQIGRKI
jgi:hypothetical protein